MSVKIKRREEKRNTALPQFLLSAAIPLLLTGWLGFSLGSTSKQDQAVSRATAAQERQRAVQTEEKLQAWESYVYSLDSLKEESKEVIDNQSELLNEAFNSFIADQLLGMDALDDWRRGCRNARSSLLDEKDDIVNALKNQDIIEEIQLVQVGNLLEGYIHESFESLFSRQRLLERRHNDGQSIRNDCDDQVEDLNDRIADLEDDLEEAQEDKSDLQERLQDCRSQAMAAGGGPIIDNSPYKSAIEGALGRLASFSDQLGGGFLGLNSNARNQVQNTITTEVGVIRTNLSNIE